MELTYGEVYLMDEVEARKRLVDTYQATGSLSLTARLWHTSRQGVRQWVRRYQERGEEGLRDPASPDWAVEGGNDLSAHYKPGGPLATHLINDLTGDGKILPAREGGLGRLQDTSV